MEFPACDGDLTQGLTGVWPPLLARLPAGDDGDITSRPRAGAVAGRVRGLLLALLMAACGWVLAVSCVLLMGKETGGFLLRGGKTGLPATLLLLVLLPLSEAECALSTDMDLRGLLGPGRGEDFGVSLCIIIFSSPLPLLPSFICIGITTSNSDPENILSRLLPLDLFI